MLLLCKYSCWRCFKLPSERWSFMILLSFTRRADSILSCLKSESGNSRSLFCDTDKYERLLRLPSEKGRAAR